jgi:hypothetical protein
LHYERTAEQLGHELADGLQHVMELFPAVPAQKPGMDKVEARLTPKPDCASKYQPLIRTKQQGSYRTLHTNSETEAHNRTNVFCHFQQRSNVVSVTVVGPKNSAAVSPHQACLWLLVLLWLGVPGSCRNSLAWGKLGAALGTAARA